MRYWIDKLWRTKALAINETCRRSQGLRADIYFAAPMVGAPPNNIGAQRLAEGGVPTSGAGSATMNAKEIGI